MSRYHAHEWDLYPDQAFRSLDGRRLLTLEGGKSKAPPPPDYTELAAASREAAQMGYDLGMAQIDASKAEAEMLRDFMNPLLTQQMQLQSQAQQASIAAQEQALALQGRVADSQMALMEQQRAQGDDYFNYMKSTFRPVEEGLVADAQNFSTEASQEQLARKAVADTEQAAAMQQAMQARQNEAQGVNANSARAEALRQQAGLQTASQRAGAYTNSREKSDALSWAKKMDAAGLGRGLPGASQGAYGLAINAGNSAGNAANGMSGAGSAMSSAAAQGSAGLGQLANAYAMPGQMTLAGMNAGTGTIMGGQNAMIGGLGQVGSLQNSSYNSALQANANASNGFWGGLGSLAGAGATFFSDRRLKCRIERLGTDVLGLGVYAWNYVWGGGRQVGYMADEVLQKFPDAVSMVGEFMAVDYGLLSRRAISAHGGQLIQGV